MAKVNDQYSFPVQQEEGLPQGSVLSCTCFLIAIKEIATNLHLTIQKNICRRRCNILLGEEFANNEKATTNSSK